MTTIALWVGRHLFRQVTRDDVMGLSAELAYRFFLALFPFAIFVAGVGAFVAGRMGIENPATQLSDQLSNALPSEAATLIGREVNRVIERQDPGLISFAVLGAVFFATGGTNAMIKAMNRAFDVEETRPFWRRYLVALGMTVLAGVSLVGAFALFVSGQVIAGDLATRLGLTGVVWDAVGLLRWPVTVLLLLVSVIVLYRVGPNLRIALWSILPGAAVFVIGWLAATWAFGFYVSNFASYGATYGALAGVAILMIWFYLTAFVLLLGVEINDVLLDFRRLKRVVERMAPSRGDIAGKSSTRKPATGARRSR